MSKAKTDSIRSFQSACTDSWGMIESNGKALCILCKDSVVCRTSSVKRHFESSHNDVERVS